MEVFMKIVVIGGSGLIGSQVVNKLKELGHTPIPASRSSGVNVISGEGLIEALDGADVVIDVSNSPSFEDQACMEFFRTSTSNLINAEKKSKVKHHVLLSVVGTGIDSPIGYFRAKAAQENLVRLSNIPFTIVKATQFFEFLDSIAQLSSSKENVQVATAFIQPIASDDVSEAVVKAALENPMNGEIEIAGPDRFEFAEIVDMYLKANNDSRTIVADPNTGYFGALIDKDALIPKGKAKIGAINFQQWLENRAKV